MPRKPSIDDFDWGPFEQYDRPRDRADYQLWPGYWIYHNRDDSISFGNDVRDYFGTIPAAIAVLIPAGLVLMIAGLIAEGHRAGRKEARDYLERFVLSELEVPRWPHEPMRNVRAMTPPPLPGSEEK